MKYHIAITTCDREAILMELLGRLGQLRSESPHDLEIWIYDDGEEPLGLDYPYYKVLEGPPHGKRLYWKVMRKVWMEARQRMGSWDGFFFMQDDISIPQDDFFERAATLMERLEEKTTRPAAINFFGDGPDFDVRARWTGRPVTHSPVSGVLSAKWIDLQCVLFYRRAVEAVPAIEPVPQDRWIIDPGLSSGVGRQISRRLCGLGYGQYMVREPWVTHDPESIMNPHREGQVYA